ncbi:MAG: MmcQ/YjbR family DNA-binding protein [Eggerthellaceae bacterium]|nr:MmcQ/YjbR family DNA-binding protein [Eggerthellaceae bacterium]
MNRNELEEYIQNAYGVAADYPWAKYPEYAVFRHVGNKKWFALIMNITSDKLGLEDGKEIDVVDLKCDPDLLDIILMENGFYPAYHMNKSSWVTSAIDGSADPERIKVLLDMSYAMTSSGKTASKKDQKRPE